jgi:acetyl-CoA carboxylase biotin carboxyl carrier protein
MSIIQEDPRDVASGLVTGEHLRLLSDEARRLAADLDGPLRRIHLRAGLAAVELEWGVPGPAGAEIGGTPPPVGAAVAAPTEVSEHPAVRSPMVGTFYHAASPGEAAFVSVGDTVGADTVIGIVEAMKLMNTITAEQAGVVREVVVADGKPVEFDQPLVLLDPMPGS